MLRHLSPKTKQLWQATSVIRADNMIRVAIRRTLGYPHGYCHKTWIFRISRCSADENNVIRSGDCVACAICCKPYPWFTRKTWFVWRFDAHWVIAMDIPMVLRIMQSARDIAPLAQSIISIVARIASWNEPYQYYGFRAPGAVSVMTRRNPKGELPLCQAIFTAGSITNPAHRGHIMCLVYSRMPLKDTIIEPEYGRVW